MQEKLRGQLQRLVHKHFDLSEIREVCFQLDIPYEDLAGPTKKEKTISLVEYCERHSRTSDLIYLCREERPRIKWPSFYGSAPSERTPLYYTAASDMVKPAPLFGRNQLITEIDTMLFHSRQVLLYGLGGSGKTALASTTAYRRLQRGDGPVIWYEAAHDEAETVFDAIAQRFGTEEERGLVHMSSDQAKLDAVHSILSRHADALLVLDNVWKGATLRRLLRATPGGLRLLITSRLKFALPGMMAVEKLSLEGALELLSHHAGKDYSEDARAKELCRILGYHAYAVEIAGNVLRSDGRIRERRFQLIARAPTEIEVPGGFLDRPNVAALLRESYEALEDPETKAVFRTAGALSAAGTTPDLLATYLGRDPTDVWRSLEHLVDRSLAKFRLVDYKTVDGGEIDYYTFHDLTFSYARSLFRAEGGEEWSLVPAVKEYVNQYAERTAYLHQDLTNILAAARIARTEDEEAFIEILTPLAVNGYMDNYGHTLEFLVLLDEAIDLVRKQGDRSQAALHMLISKRANGYRERGDWASALQTYQEAYATGPNEQRRAMALAMMGLMLYRLEDYEAGDGRFNEAVALAQTEDDDFAWAFALQQRSGGLGEKGEYSRALEYARRSVEVASRFKEHVPFIWQISMHNLGSAEMRLGNVTTAVQIHRELLALAEEENNPRLRAVSLHALGLDLHAQGDVVPARQHLMEALGLYKDIGYTVKEAEVVSFLQNMEEIG